ncbi:MAG: DUF1295 domain-containing protein [Methylobacteriaceae bacterium]|nr:DUF1295 domain-containing protein [Methylobacteriaceae bacterium]
MTLLVFLEMLAAVSLALFLIMSLSWIVWRRTGNSGWIDTIWTFGLGAIGGIGSLTAAAFTGAAIRPYLVAALIGVWALRLGMHIAQRTRGITDDPRYAELQREWGRDAPRQMFWLVQKQTLVSIPLALSILLAAANPLPQFRVQDGLGALVLLVAIVGEGISDAQLRQFNKDAANRKRVCDVGLWSWSRHPNYFFEWFGWLAYPLIASDIGGSYSWGWMALAGPACMYWLLVYVSGIPPLEAHMLAVRGDAFREYQSRTNAFFPAPPRERRRV